MVITIIAGARPNFMKIAPVLDAIKNAQENGRNIHYRLVHTGQHYDKKMSGDFFEQLGIPEPDVNLEAGGGTQAQQTAAIMVRFEEELIQNPTDLVLVVGDVTSTMACSIVAKKLNNTKVAHIEAGIRSGDLTMPEEINRIVTDSITDYFFTTSLTAGETLRASGIDANRIHFVGNTMIDTLLKQMPNFVEPPIWSELHLRKYEYVVMTLHRPANVDEESKLKNLIETIVNSARGLPILFPVHPRTAKMLAQIGIDFPSLYMVEPLSYLEFNYLVKNAKAVVTDSGGITEETTVMGIPCMTLRDNTERPETISQGTNELLGTNPITIPPAFEKLFRDEWKTGRVPDLWDGRAAERIIERLLKIFNC
jgi:UDP-N-acetylglucosamine 2-epimerase (non-hydrolysing)